MKANCVIFFCSLNCLSLLTLPIFIFLNYVQSLSYNSCQVSICINIFSRANLWQELESHLMEWRRFPQQISQVFSYIFQELFFSTCSSFEKNQVFPQNSKIFS